MADTHYHTCQLCNQNYECLFELGTCNYKCDTCAGPQREINPREGWLLSNTWTCATDKCGTQPRNDALACPKCGYPKPAEIAKCNSCQFPISEYHPERCWNGHATTLAAEETGEKGEEVEATKECPNCCEDITDDNPAKVWDGNSMCSSCYPICSSCDTELDKENYFSCDKCNDYLCEGCARFCRCCDVYLCESHAENHGA